MQAPGVNGGAAGRRQLVVLALVAGAALLLVGRVMLRRPPDPAALLVEQGARPDVFVHIAGEVVLPGVHRLPAGARWADAVAAARGATHLADLDAINLAQPLRDGERVFIPRVAEPAMPGNGAQTEGEGAVSSNSRTQAPAAVDLNKASAVDLEALPGIGPVLAARIIEHRRVHGAFQRLEDLREVEGIGPRILARLRPLLRIK